MPASESAPAAAATTLAKRYLSFAEIVPSAIQVPVEPDGLIWGVPLVMAVTGKNRNDSTKVFRDLPDEVFNQQKILIRYFPG